MKTKLPGARPCLSETVMWMKPFVVQLVKNTTLVLKVAITYKGKTSLKGLNSRIAKVTKF